MDPDFAAHPARPSFGGPDTWLAEPDSEFAKAVAEDGSPCPPASGKRRRTGFSLTELAIVIVIAGVLAAVAIPIDCGGMEKSPWSEGKSNTGLLQAAFKVLKAENSGTLSGYTGGVGPINYSELDLDATEFDGTNFVSTDYRVAAINTRAGTWTIAVSSSVAGGPTGTYTIDETGTTGGDAP